jgi:hypothetical protein
LYAERRNDPNESVQGNTLALFKPTYGSWRDACFLGKLSLSYVAGQPYAFQSLAEGGFDLVTCCHSKIDAVRHILPITSNT